MDSPRAHIEEIRRVNFNIGGSSPNPLAGSLHQAIIHLSAELYQKDVHFISELIQNAEDNAYQQGVEPTLELVLTDEDIAEVGAPATLLLFNNEKGFEARHVSALCAVGNSTKKGQRNEGYIGEKGIGFKSVFLVTSTPYIISNGYRIRFSDKATSAAEIAYIVPEWVDRPTDEKLQHFCVEGEKLPTTTLVLPLQVDKVAAVQKELKQLSPETIMFLKRITRLRVRDETQSKSEIHISRFHHPRMGLENGFLSSMRLSVGKVPENIFEVCNYYVAEQNFPVEASVEQRKEVKKWTITLVFPYLNRPSAHQTTGDIFAFLPSQLKSGFPFIVNADFLLVSSRETLRFNSIWNLGILGCIPIAFLNAFKGLLADQQFTSGIGSPGITIEDVYKYIPVAPNLHPELDTVRTTIVTRLKEEDILLVDGGLGHQLPSRGGKFFCKPALGRQIAENFRQILQKSYSEGAVSPSISGSTCYIVDGVVQKHHPDILKALGVSWMSWFEYLSIMMNSDWIMMLSEDLYLQVVKFVAIDILQLSGRSPEALLATESVPLLKYQMENGSCSLATIREVKEKKVKIYILSSNQGAWLSEWINSFKPWITVYFLPQKTAVALEKLKQSQDKTLTDWLKQCALISELSAESYAVQLMEWLAASQDREFVLLVTKALHNSVQNSRFDLTFVSTNLQQLPRIPVVDESGSVLLIQRGQNHRSVLLPRHGSKWPVLIVDNTWSHYLIRMSDDYLVYYPNRQRLDPQDAELYKSFLRAVFGATDLPELVPPNDPLPASILSGHMTQQQTSYLLEWVDYSKRFAWPWQFLSSIKATAWLKTERHGTRCPQGCFLPSNELTAFFKPGDVPFVDKSFYGDCNNSSFQYVLRDLGVITKPGDYGSCEAVAAVVRNMATGSETTDLEQAIRLYRFLQQFQWRPTLADLLIFIPRPVGWKSPQDCVIEDKHRLFKNLLPVLQEIYPKDLLPFFRLVLNVPKKAGIDGYCNFWVAWKVDLSKQDKC